MRELREGSPDKLLLIKESNMVAESMKSFYGGNYIAIGIPNKTSATDRHEIIKDIQETITDQYKLVICADPDMFKTLTGFKSTGKDGIACDSPLGKCFIIPNWASILYNPAQEPRIKFILERIEEYMNTGISSILGSDVLKNVKYCLLTDIPSYHSAFTELSNHEALSVDIETTGLHHYNSTIISIAFSWNEHEGIAMEVSDNKSIKTLLRLFFLNYKGKKIFHNATFDTMFLIYHCFMKNLEDWEGMLEGLHCIYNNLEDTRVIAYLALNTCNLISLGLKDLAHEYTGDYAQSDIDDCSNIPLERLLPYNVTDTCATWYVYNKYKPVMLQDKQEEIYLTLMLPSLKVLTETQLVGFRLNPNKVNDLATFLYNKEYKFESELKTNTYVITFEEELKKETVIEYNNTHKKTRRTIEDYKDEWLFNFNSNQQVGKFLYEYLKLPIIETTKAGAPSVGADTLEKLVHHTNDDKVQEVLNNLYELSKVNKIINAFLGNFTEAVEINGKKGLYGSFNLCGTKSGRLSSSNPNLQQMPATGSPYAKPVKKIFTSPDGYVFVGADQRALEDHISALTTKDTNKLKVYLENYDGHCLRSYSYYTEQMPDIEAKMKYADKEGKYFKVTLDDGTVKYFYEDDPEYKELVNA